MCVDRRGAEDSASWPCTACASSLPWRSAHPDAGRGREPLHVGMAMVEHASWRYAACMSAWPWRRASPGPARGVRYHGQGRGCVLAVRGVQNSKSLWSGRRARPGTERCASAWPWRSTLHASWCYMACASSWLRRSTHPSTAWRSCRPGHGGAHQQRWN
jgi:hypothetical protein